MEHRLKGGELCWKTHNENTIKIHRHTSVFFIILFEGMELFLINLDSFLAGN